MERGQEVPGGLIVTCGDGAELLDPTKEVLNQMTSFVQRLVIRPGVLSVLFWRDDDGFPGCLQWLDHPLVGVVSPRLRRGMLCRRAMLLLPSRAPGHPRRRGRGPVRRSG